ncbi:hypothetical protein [Pseudodesulfovibrio methanolicus]|uniref:Uncharacterized protein n=1 Tax=Pseudodesulfovibrio methanolicus TaxID=3126690 RepID=A0ABZ2IZF9_9BACT
MHINRAFHFDFLNKLADKYPDKVPEEMVEDYVLRWCEEHSVSPAYIGFSSGEHSLFLDANLKYLEEHELIKTGRSLPTRISSHGNQSTPFRLSTKDAHITAKGLDFLLNDGGLSAILNTVTVKFDVGNIRELVEAGLLTANVPEEKQGALMKAIREAPGTMLQTAVTKMVEKGMSDPVGTAKAVAGLFGIMW